jgi:hypothetical protein
LQDKARYLINFHQVAIFYRNVTVYQSAHFGQGSGQIMMDGLKCKGEESHIAACNFQGWGINDCSHGEDAGVTCGMLNRHPYKPNTSTNHTMMH